MKTSFTLRLIIIGLLTCLMSIPLFFASETINSRADYSRSTIQSVSRDWGGAQSIGAPMLIVPVTARVNRTSKIDVVDPVTGLVQLDPVTGKPLQKVVTRTVTEHRNPIYLAPATYDLTVSSVTEERHRGLFHVPVYKSNAVANLTFAKTDLDKALRRGEIPIIAQTTLRVPLGVMRSLRGEASLQAGNKSLALEAATGGGSQNQGVSASVGQHAFNTPLTLTLGFNGAQKFQVTPYGTATRIALKSDWPHPSFFGAFLPDNSTIDETGFDSTWTIPHLSLGLPLTSREDIAHDVRNQAQFGVSYYQPNDFYQKAFRAGRYGLLFTALTFLTVLLIERRSSTPVHPIQYIFIGLAQSLFVVLMVALAEQIGFASAYVGASAATIGLITLYGAVVLKLGQRTFALGGALSAIYGILYMILQAEDLALLAGSIFAFAALAIAMFATRNETWSNPNMPTTTWFKKKGSEQPAT